MQKLAEICVRRPVFATMLIMSLVVVGLFSYKSLGVDLFPKIDLPTITVTVVNPGASPQEIETEITDKVEGAVNTVSGIDELRSTSVEGVSQVFITFLLEKNPDIAAQEVRNKIDLIVNDLPVTAEQPIVQKLDTDAAPVVRIAVSAPRSLREVTEVADKRIKEQIESINGVGNVDIIGGRRREIQIWVDPDKMRSFNVTVAQVADAIRTQNMEVPGGRIEEGERELTVRTMGRIIEPAQFNNLVVANRGTYSPIDLHQSLDRVDSNSLNRGEHPRGHSCFHLPLELSLDFDCGTCHTDFADRDIRINGGDGFHAQSNHDAGVDLDGWHRD